MSAESPPTGVGVTLRGVRREFPGNVLAVDHMDLVIEASQFIGLVGPSGCGKSTLLRMIAGLDQPTEGSILCGDSGIAGRKIAYVFQDAHLLPWRTVLRNVELPLELAGVNVAERRRWAQNAIEQVGLTDSIGRYPNQLSGGMRMRVSLARALVTNPDLLLLDEPFAALDEITRHQLDDQLHELWRQRRMTVIFVTHSILEAAFLAQRVIVLSRRPARIVLDHTLDLPPHRTPQLRTDPAFAGQMGILFEALQRGERMPA